MVQSGQNVDNFISKDTNKLQRGISMIVYGDPGVGKTTLATTLPAGETLIVNTEAGIGVLLGTGHIIFNVREAIMNGVSLEDAMTGLYRKIRTKEFAVKNVIIDNVSELLDQLRIHYTEARDKPFPEIREHGDAAYKLLAWVHEWRDLQELGINVVFNAWELPYDIQQSDGITVTKTAPMVGKSSTKRICGLVDVVARLEVHDKTGRRWLRIAPSSQYLTKSQFLGLDDGEVPDLTIIIDKIKAYDYTKEEDKKDAKITSPKQSGTSTSRDVPSKDPKV
jgi:phage nucleotide-binding protein